jgi:hypothetical protein
MAVGTPEESVEVTAETTRLQTDSPTLGTTLTTASLQDLPLDFAGVRNAAGFPFKISPGECRSKRYRN